MRKRIALFIGEISWHYQETITRAIIDKANSLDYDVMVFCTYGYYYEKHLLYSVGERACIHIPDCSMFDGIIVAEDVFDIEGMDNELYDILQKTAKCPIVYLRTQRDNCYSILLEDKLSIEQMTRHFTDVHGFRDICYMSGKAGNQDAIDRMNGYLCVMEEHNIPVTEHMIFHGDYWRLKGEQAVNWFMDGRDTYPEAIVCANDYMALSICEELRKRGVKIPEEVCVSGFDFVDEAKTYEPTLTSLEVDFEKMAEEAVAVIHNVNNNIKTDYIKRYPAKLCLHGSCGCGEQFKFSGIQDMIDHNQQQISDTKDILLATMDYQDAFELDEYMTVAEKYHYFIRSTKSYFCFSDEGEQDFNAVENDTAFTKNMILRRIMEKNKPVQKLEKHFSRTDILPEEYLKSDKPTSYFIFSIHFKNIVYGYMVTNHPGKEWFDIYTQGYLMALSSAIANSSVHEQMEHLEEIRSLYQKDALTGIFNRRGFDKLLQDSIVSARFSGNDFGLVSIDMDNLKYINDTFGHSEGDRAITILANTLNSVMKQGDFCARTGGDEFSAFINVPYPERVEEFKMEFSVALERESAHIDQYPIGASIGICTQSEDPTASLISCIQIADKRMYENKRARKASAPR